MIAEGGTAQAPRSAPLRIVGGGAPSPPELAALTAALTALLESEAAAPDPAPAAYRSRWRRAGLVEASEVPVQVKDVGPPWGAQ